jgi:bacillithiol system protein YtxJ
MATIKPYFLDLISYRSISNAVADSFGIRHESPQLLIIYKGECVYHASHMGISYPGLKMQVESLMKSA